MWNYEVRQRIGKSKILPQWEVWFESKTGWGVYKFVNTEEEGHRLVKQLWEDKGITDDNS
ncbi:hypothetical protein LCGC14_1935430 [marine sediment metagenome]|uniref:Uncharacterized protein n=1 Tax=marine sediment metagenome TaxID=412755 RepID=A0A0F9FM88_9ZZZZ